MKKIMLLLMLLISINTYASTPFWQLDGSLRWKQALCMEGCIYRISQILDQFPDNEDKKYMAHEVAIMRIIMGFPLEDPWIIKNFRGDLELINPRLK